MTFEEYGTARRCRPCRPGHPSGDAHEPVCRGHRPFLAAAIALSSPRAGRSRAAGHGERHPGWTRRRADRGRTRHTPWGSRRFPRRREGLGRGWRDLRLPLPRSVELCVRQARLRVCSGGSGRTGASPATSTRLSADLVAKKHRYARPIVLVDTVTAVVVTRPGQLGGVTHGVTPADRVVVTVGAPAGTSVVDARDWRSRLG